jgi:hypothetical protein
MFFILVHVAPSFPFVSITNHPISRSPTSRALIYFNVFRIKLSVTLLLIGKSSYCR